MANLERVEYFQGSRQTRKRFWYKCDWCGDDTCRSKKMDGELILCKPCREKRNKDLQKAHKLKSRLSPNLVNKRRSRPPKVRPKVEVKDIDLINAKCAYCGKDFYRTEQWAYRYYLWNGEYNYTCTYGCLNKYKALWDYPQKEVNYYEA